MTFSSGLAVYFIFWWLALLLVLPFGVRTQQEAGSVEPGTVASAPASPMFRRQLLIATLLAGAVFAVFYVVWTNDLITLDDFPVFDPPSASRTS